MRASYDLDSSVPGVVLLVDRDLPGCMSITNAAEVVVEDLRAHGLLAGRRVVYRDTDGTWDELLHDGEAFAGFRSLGARSREDVLALLAAPHRKET